MSQREPVTNIPGVVLVLGLTMAAIQGARALLLDGEQDAWVLLAFAFIPARFDGSLAASWGFPGGNWGDAWSFVTYAFLHGDWTHLLVNLAWMTVFGSAVARRFGAARTLLFFAFTAAFGALAHMAAVGSTMTPMVGASAAVSGFTAAALRFVFEPGGPMRGGVYGDLEAYRMPAASLGEMVRNPTVLMMVVIWTVLNVLVGAIDLPILGIEARIAWQAHAGGFIAGLLGFVWFDPVGRRVRGRE